jgi:hypothetical protein
MTSAVTRLLTCLSPNRSCGEFVSNAWETSACFVEKFPAALLKTQNSGLFRRPAGKSTAHLSAQMQTGFRAAGFSTNPQQSSQQQESFVEKNFVAMIVEVKNSCPVTPVTRSQNSSAYLYFHSVKRSEALLCPLYFARKRVQYASG